MKIRSAATNLFLFLSLFSICAESQNYTITLFDQQNGAGNRMAGNRRPAGRAAIGAGFRSQHRAVELRGAIPRRRRLRLASRRPVLPPVDSPIARKSLCQMLRK